MEKEVKKTLTSIEVPAVGKATAFVPNIQFIAETFNISNIINDNTDAAINAKNQVPTYVSFTYDEIMIITDYINSIKAALLNNK